MSYDLAVLEGDGQDGCFCLCIFSINILPVFLTGIGILSFYSMIMIRMHVPQMFPMHLHMHSCLFVF